jgi:hypothetical protein
MGILTARVETGCCVDATDLLSLFGARETCPIKTALRI